jgi:hypothetical protein
MAQIRSVDFLPEIFRTDTNKQFLAATLDVLTQEPQFKKTQGYIGRTVGPGVTADDRYVVEPDRVRADYQLEPGVICLEQNQPGIKQAMTYPGISEAIQFQGGQPRDTDRLMQSEYYTWDPFVDFDSFVNFSQYYWLPSGPDAVTVAATEIPVTNDFVVTRENGVYTFSGVPGTNPQIELVRGGNYRFLVSQNQKETVNFRVKNQGSSAYLIDGQANPTLTLTRGNTYVFNVTLQGIFPFWIKTQPSLGTDNAYNQGVTRNGSATGLITFVVPFDAPDTLYYASQNSTNLRGTLQIVDAQAGTGPGFWIQAAPGVSGTMPANPNISSRSVAGVLNNGEDLGTVFFDVPKRTSQQFYYDMPTLAQPVDLITDLMFNQLNNQPLDQVIQRLQGYDDAGFNGAAENAEPGSFDYDVGPTIQPTTLGATGIDGINSLQNKTLIFNNVVAGWERTTLFDPLTRTRPTAVGESISYDVTGEPYDQEPYNFITDRLISGQLDPADNRPGSFDSTLYDQVTPIPLEDRNQLWQISVIDRNGIAYVELNKISNIAPLTKFTIRYGETYSNTSWYKTSTGRFDQIPLLTAVQDTLWYQDGTDPEIFGTIRLVDPVESSTLFVEDIIGKQNYTSPNGVKFTNGLKVVFRGDVLPTSYRSGTDSFLCVGTNGEFDTVITSSPVDLYIGQRVEFLIPPAGGGLEPGKTYYVISLVNQFEFTVSETPGGNPVTLESTLINFTATAISYREYYVAGVGTAIKLLPVTDFIVLETYASASGFGIDPNALPLVPDYITIDRDSPDLNAWARSNRWFHVDVITATADYNNTVVDISNAQRARRPIIQFRSGIRLYNMGTQGKQPVDIIDFDQTDAFSNVQGATSYSINGYTLINGSRVIFANDADPTVSNKIWTVEFVTPDTVPPLIAQPIINLTPTVDNDTLVDQCVISLHPVRLPDGSELSGYTFYFDGVVWQTAQLKQSVNQPPLFDVYDLDGVSFGNRVKYPSSDFVGSKLFSYALGTGQKDPVLGFPLQYLSVANIGDIVYENNLYTDQFVYTRDAVSVTGFISQGTPRQYFSRTRFQRLLGWQTAISSSRVYQQFKFINDGTPLRLDIAVGSATKTPPLKIYADARFVEPSNYTFSVTDNSTEISLPADIPLGSVVEVAALSPQVSDVAFYQVPINLSNNPLNVNSKSFTLGTIRTHYQSLCENLRRLSGPILGPNNTRDLGNIVPYGLTILQQSAPLTLAGYFLRSNEFNLFDSLVYNSREYIKFKSQILENITRQEIQFQTAAELLDSAIETLNAGKGEMQPFYWSDMLPSGAVYSDINYVISIVSINTFDTQQVYDYTSANFLALGVYLNDVLLVRNRDYVVATDGPRVTILIPLSVGDRLTLREYNSTYGNFCPNTPTKLGLYPSWRPEITIQKTTTGQQTVIIGHDGSVTPTFGDLRDQVLLEFETRIFNNLKLDGNPVPLTAVDVIPGQFRQTGYSVQEVEQILNEDFLSYVAWNKLDYRSQRYQANNEFSYNYSSALNRLDNQPLPGSWRGINWFFYDTEQPQYTPWEMLGLAIKPDWWEEIYGAAPYTRENLVLWDDLEAGLVRDPAGEYLVPAYARPGLQQVIPLSSQGELLSPLESVVGLYDAQQFRRSWDLEDGGPVQASWRNSSAYPFAVMRLLALTRPAKFFALFADRDLYRYNAEFQQYLYNQRYRLDANGVSVYGNGVSKASYINWIVDYNRQIGLDSTTILEQDLANLDVQLCYRMASYSDKKYIKLLTEKSSPGSNNTSFLIPDESYDLVLYKNQPSARTVYSAVIVQKTPGGYAIFGYSTVRPFFTSLRSQTGGTLETIGLPGLAVQIPTRFTDKTYQLSYGYIFADKTSVSEFLLGYGRYLETQGLIFDDMYNGYQLNWRQMVVEFLYWDQQGWEENSVIVLNPLASGLSLTADQGIVDSIVYQTYDKVLLDQNRRELPVRDLNIVRLDNSFKVEPLVDRALSYLDVGFTSYEHMIVLKNVSLFGDLVFDPVTGARQSRLNLIAVTTNDWTGTVNSPGFILNQNNVREWTRGTRYSKGEIVKFKDSYWSAATIVQPSEQFNFSDWVQSDYEQIELGLLPNLPNKADQLINSYNINQANLESDNDLLSYGLIGFRPREYMSSLQLDDTSQVNIYRQFLDTKGTILSAELFAKARLTKESADYDIYENWAVQRAVFGANANRRFVELRLNRALLSANPGTVQIVRPGQPSAADQTVLLSDLWRQSYQPQSTEILPTTTISITDSALPTAGYVNVNDVDITLFDLLQPNSLNGVIDQIQVGSKIWAAKVNNYDWDVYRVDSVPGAIKHVCDNLDGTSLVIFSEFHGLALGQLIIIKFFDASVDGVYRVLSIPSLNKITIGYRFIGSQSVINGTGIGFILQSMRVAQLSDVADLPNINTINPGTRVWADNDGNDRWTVVEVRDVFGAVTEIGPITPYSGSAYGVSVSQAFDQYATLVGAPDYVSVPLAGNTLYGGVYTYVKNFSNVYTPISPTANADAVLTLATDGARGFGNAVEFGARAWAAAGASASLGANGTANHGYVSVIFQDPSIYTIGSNPYYNWQLLSDPNNNNSAGEFGHSLAMSQDERWLYVGAPGINQVFAYGRVDWQDQQIVIISDGSTLTFDISNTIQIDNNNQLEVFLDGTLQTLGSDYSVALDFSSVTFSSVPAQGSKLTIRRRKNLALDPAQGPVYADIGQYFFTVNSSESLYSFAVEVVKEFTVTVDDQLTVVRETQLQRPDIDYGFGADSSLALTFNYAFGPEVKQINLRAQGYWQFVQSLQVAGLAADARFGHSVVCSTDGRQVAVGAPGVEVNDVAQAGLVYTFDRNVQKFVFGQDLSTMDSSVTVLGTLVEPVGVLVNSSRLINENDATVGAIDTFTVAGNTITINAELSVGDVIEVETNQFRLTQTISQDTPEEFANFGWAVDLCNNNCSLYVGAPQSNLQIYKGGAVQRSVSQASVYGTITSTNTSPALTPGDTLRVNDIDVAVPVATGTVSSLQGLVNNINAQVPNVTATLQSDNRVVIAVTRLSASVPNARVEVLPGSLGTAFYDLGFEMFVFTQTIVNAYPKAYAGFGYSLSVSDTARELIVGSPQGTMYFLAVFDDGDTDFDADATEFFSEIVQCGTVLVYNLLPSANPSVNNPGKFVFGQQLTVIDAQTGIQFGASVNYTSGALWIGASGPGLDLAQPLPGRAFVFENFARLPAWLPIHVQQPVVDVQLLNSVFLYDLNTSATTEFLDFFDPLQGKILGAARENIDFIGSVDPAVYNSGAEQTNGPIWGAVQVGQVWWNTARARFIDTNQDSIAYASQRWGQLFPGSSVDVYQWTVSPVPPANYTGPGTVFNILNYSISSTLTNDGIIATNYYFWVQGIETVASQKGKTLSVRTVASYIENPRATGIPYLAPVSASAVAIYNCGDLIEAQDTVLHIEFDQEYNTDNVHVEYELVAQGRPDEFLSEGLYKKLQDSFCGVDTAGNLVPDITMNPAERYGTQFRPRQSMFIDRFLALKNYIVSSNKVMIGFPIAESKSLNLLLSSDPVPPSSTSSADSSETINWNQQVPTYEILLFQNLSAVDTGYKYLVLSDETQKGRWTIYQVVSSQSIPGGKTFLLVQVQSWVTREFWNYVDWYQIGYNPSVKPVLEVPSTASLSTITVPVGSSVKVAANGQGKWEIYQRNLSGFVRVGLQDGTVAIDASVYDYAFGRFGFDVEVFDAQYFDEAPFTETRKIIQSLNEEIFTGDLLIERNRLLTLMFDYILSEFSAPEWLVKTSLIDVDHRVRELLPFPNYVRDNQEFVIDYIQEVKPYHVQVREFNLTYQGQDQYSGDAVDFDVPAYWDTSLEIPQFVSPILLPYTAGTAQVSNFLSDAPPDDPIWSQWPWSQWYSNFTLSLDSIRVFANGVGYTDPPLVVITGEAQRPATAQAVINSLGQVVDVIVVDRGLGYRTTPTVELVNGNGQGARARPIMVGAGLAQNYNTQTVTRDTQGYNLVRSMKTTLRYDRYQYRSRITDWNSEETYENGRLVRYLDRVWRAANQDGSSAVVGPTFDFEDWIPVPAEVLSGVDRTRGYYVAGVNSPGLDLPLLIDGIDYPGVQVWGDYFLGTETLDVIYKSSFRDLFLGLNPSDINVDGGEFIGPYEGHAPEELVNGSEFDTVDIRVFTRPGSDWQGDGHGFEAQTINADYAPITNMSWSWTGLVENPVTLLVTNQTTGLILQQDLDYVVDWASQTVTVLNGRATPGDVIAITAWELGGGSQLYRSNFTGAGAPGGIFYVPVSADEIQEVVIFQNGRYFGGTVTWQPWQQSQPWSISQSYTQQTVVQSANLYYRALRSVPAGIEITNITYWYQFVPTLQSQVVVTPAPAADDGIAVVVMGVSSVPVEFLTEGRQYTIEVPGNTNWSSVGSADNNAGTEFVATGRGTGTGVCTTLFSWSTLQVQTQEVDTEVLINGSFVLENPVPGTNSVNMIVNINGRRLQPPAGREFTSDGITVSYGLPQRLGPSFQQSTINAITDIQVWVDNVLQTQSFGNVQGDFSVTNWNGSNTPGRQVIFSQPPQTGARILITVSTLAEYSLSGTRLLLNTPVNLGDNVLVYTFNDTAQQNLLTQTFTGAVSVNQPVQEPYDYTVFDTGNITEAPGSYDFASEATLFKNLFVLDRDNISANRLWVTLDGFKLAEGRDYVMQGRELILASGVIGPAQVLAVTEFADSVVPDASAFRIFQDMRGVQATYRITAQTTTALTQALSALDDVVYVDNVLALAEPNLELGLFGVLTVDGERITYRERDVANNAVRGLRRGTAGTAAADHVQGTAVYDMGVGNLLDSQYQNYTVSDTAVGDGSTTVFYAPNITPDTFDDSSTIYVHSIEVYVGGVRQYQLGDTSASSAYRWIVTDYDPLAIEFVQEIGPVAIDAAPPAGVEVTILQRRGLGWYGPGVSQTQGLALQETNTVVARFLTGR